MIRNYSLLCLLGMSVYFVAYTVARVVIVGGAKAEGNQFSYMVSVQINGHECGGGIIDDRFILTAAHCVVKNDGYIRPGPFSIVAGTNNLDSKSAKIVEVKKVFLPREYNIILMNSPGDIAVLMLNNSLELSTSHGAMRKLKWSHDRSVSYSNKMAEIAGFGWHWVQIKNHRAIGNSTDNHLRYAKAKILRRCKQGHRDLSRRHICAELRPHANHVPQGVCIGDSGGPLVDNNDTIIGILSLGQMDCAEDKISPIYTRVSYYHDFIELAMHNTHHKDIRTRILIP